MKKMFKVLAAVMGLVAAFGMVSCSNSDDDNKDNEKKVVSVKLDKTTAEVKVGGKVTLTATVTVENDADKTVEWSSSNKNLAEVDANGVVTGVGAGDVDIIAKSKADSSKKATCKVTVKDDSVTPPPASEAKDEEVDITKIATTVDTMKARAFVSSEDNAESSNTKNPKVCVKDDTKISETGNIIVKSDNRAGTYAKKTLWYMNKTDASTGAAYGDKLMAIELGKDAGKDNAGIEFNMVKAGTIIVTMCSTGDTNTSSLSLKTVEDSTLVGESKDVTGKTQTALEFAVTAAGKYKIVCDGSASSNARVYKVAIKY